jgi:Protein of unknown function (DUF2950)
MNARSISRNNSLLLGLACTFIAGLLTLVPAVTAQSGGKPATLPRTFSTPEQAAEALINAAEKYDVPALEALFGPGGHDLIVTGEPARDEEMSKAFATQARKKMSVAIDPKTPNRATLVVGDEDWPVPVPIVKLNGKWLFNAREGRLELLYRRIGRNELDAIQICRGYVEAQHEYALQARQGYQVHQYAQRIISTPGRKDGLAWQNEDGTWGGPVGPAVAKAIAAGYSSKQEPFHGYYFKVLKGQGPAAPLGQMDFLVKGVMIGGFALIAAPAQYRVTGVKTFMVSHDGVVYQKDLGPNTLELAKKIELFNPDRTWTPVVDE